MEKWQVLMSNDRLKRETLIVLEAVKGKKWRVVGILEGMHYLGILKEADLEKHFVRSSLFPYVAARTILAHPDCTDPDLRGILKKIYDEDEMAKTKEAAEAKAAKKAAAKPTAATAAVNIPATGKAPKAAKAPKEPKPPKLDADGNPITRNPPREYGITDEAKITIKVEAMPEGRGEMAEQFKLLAAHKNKTIKAFLAAGGQRSTLRRAFRRNLTTYA